MRRRAVVIERPEVGPAVVSRPSGVRTLEEKVAFSVVSDDEDHVTLQFFTFLRELGEIDAAEPVRWNREPHHRSPRALAQALPPYGRVRLRRALKRTEPFHVTSTLAAVMAHPVEVDHKGRRRVRADLEFDGFPGADARPGAVAFDPGTAVTRLWLGARVGQEPCGRARFLVLLANEGAHF